eukprot:gene12742-biopygen14044
MQSHASPEKSSSPDPDFIVARGWGWGAAPTAPSQRRRGRRRAAPQAPPKGKYGGAVGAAVGRKHRTNAKPGREYNANCERLRPAVQEIRADAHVDHEEQADRMDGPRHPRLVLEQEWGGAPVGISIRWWVSEAFAAWRPVFASLDIRTKWKYNRLGQATQRNATQSKARGGAIRGRGASHPLTAARLPADGLVKGRGDFPIVVRPRLCFSVEKRNVEPRSGLPCARAPARTNDTDGNTFQSSFPMSVSGRRRCASTRAASGNRERHFQPRSGLPCARALRAQMTRMGASCSPDFQLAPRPGRGLGGAVMLSVGMCSRGGTTPWPAPVPAPDEDDVDHPFDRPALRGLRVHRLVFPVQQAGDAAKHPQLIESCVVFGDDPGVCASGAYGAAILPLWRRLRRRPAAPTAPLGRRRRRRPPPPPPGHYEVRIRAAGFLRGSVGLHFLSVEQIPGKLLGQ